MLAQRFDVAAVEAWATQVLRAMGMPDAHAEEAAALIMAGELRGVHSHGLARLPVYVERFRSGEYNARPDIRHRSFPGGIVLDADGAIGHVAGARALELGLAALKDCASVMVVVRWSGHMGALKVLVERAANAGAMCLMGQSTPPNLAMEGFRGPAMGTNPLAFACPVPGAEPLVFDMSSSVAARGRITAAARANEPIPSDWAVDDQGRPTTDAHAALRGSLQPAAGAKGMGIAMMVQCLAGALSAHPQAMDALRRPIPEGGAPQGQDGFVWLLRPDAFAPADAFAAHMQGWIALYRERGAGAARLPGEGGPAKEARVRREGLQLHDSVATPLRDTGQRLGLPFPAPIGSP